MANNNGKDVPITVDKNVSDLGQRVSKIEGYIKCATWIIPIFIGVMMFILALIFNSFFGDHSVIPINMLNIVEEVIKEG